MMVKHLKLLTFLCATQHVSSHPLSRRQQTTTANTTGSAVVQKPLLFELTRGAPYTSTPQALPGGDSITDLKLTHITDDYFLKLQLAGQERYFRVDTGTGTFWVADPDFGCYNIHNQLVGPACCGLDDSIKLNATSSTTSPFYQAYDSDYYARGNLTTSQASFGNNTWPVVVGAADNIRYEGSRIESGVLGLAGPGFYMGDDTSPITLRAKPFFSQFVSLFPLLPNFFTLALSRQTAGSATNAPSYIELGGRLLNATGIASQGPVAIVPLLTVPAPVTQNVQPAFANSTGFVAEYTTMDPQFKVNDSVVDAQGELPFHTRTDSGNAGLVLPAAVAYAFNKLWYDQRVYTNGSTWDLAEQVEVDCTSVAPSLNVTFSKVDFAIDGRDLIHVGSNGRCTSLVTGTTTRGVLGVPFLKNVVAVHNLGGKRIEFTARVPY